MIDYTKYRLIIFDADGTLRRCTVEGQVCPNEDDEWELIRGVAHRIADIPRGIALAIASNQAGVGLGYLEHWIAYDMLDAIGPAIEKELGALPHRSTAVEFEVIMCPHKPNAGCVCRKPRPGMLIKLMLELNALPSHTLFVGDMPSDRQAAEEAGCDFMWARDFFGREWDNPPLTSLAHSGTL